MQPITTEILNAIDRVRQNGVNIQDLCKIRDKILDVLQEAEENAADAAQARNEIQHIAGGLKEQLHSESRRPDQITDEARRRLLDVANKASRDRRREADYVFLRRVWGEEVLEFYRWTPCLGENTLRTLKMCARYWPDFNDFVAIANVILLRRHQAAVLGFSVKLLSQLRFLYDELNLLRKLTNGFTQEMYGFEFTMFLSEEQKKLIKSWAENEPSAVVEAEDGKGSYVSGTLQGIKEDYWKSWVLVKDKFGVFIDRLPSLSAATPTSDAVSDRASKQKRPRTEDAGDDVAALRPRVLRGRLSLGARSSSPRPSVASSCRER